MGPFYHSPWMVHLGEHEELVASELGTYRDKLCGCERSVCCVYVCIIKNGGKVEAGLCEGQYKRIILI